MPVTASLSADRRALRVDWPDGVSGQYAARWLFDHADAARDPASGQRRHGALSLAAISQIAAASVEGRNLKVRFSPTAAEVSLDLRRLRAGAALALRASLWLTPKPIAEAPPILFEAFLHDDGALREALSRVARLGLALLVGAGDRPAAVELAVERFGFIRETNYGRCFDVRIETKPGNLAYTDQALDLHTDNPYRDPVPTLQLLHAIVNDETGGETLFVDGFAHAERLRAEASDAFVVLAREKVRSSFAEATGARWAFAAPVLSIDAGGALEAVRLNHRSLDLEPGHPAAVDAWYDAYLAFHARLHAPDAAFVRRLAPGELVIFDNRRIVHGRRALSRRSARWLRGCYADIDGLRATLARLERAAVGETVDAL